MGKETDFETLTGILRIHGLTEEYAEEVAGSIRNAGFSTDGAEVIERVQKARAQMKETFNMTRQYNVSKYTQGRVDVGDWDIKLIDEALGNTKPVGYLEGVAVIFPDAKDVTVEVRQTIVPPAAQASGWKRLFGTRVN